MLRNWWAGDKRRRRAYVKGTGVGTRAPGFWLEAVGNFPKMDHVRVGKKCHGNILMTFRGGGTGRQGRITSGHFGFFASTGCFVLIFF